MSLPELIHASLSISEDAIEEGALELLSIIRPSWQPESVTFKLYTDGITNKLVACLLNGVLSPETVVVVRVYGNKTDLMIDRTAELRNMKILRDTGFAPKLLASFQNGLAMEFISGDTLTTESVRDPKIWKLIAQTMAKMHKIDLSAYKEISNEPALWDKIETFLALIPETRSDALKQQRFVSAFGSVTKIRIEYERLKSHLTKVSSPIVFAHNDLLLGNVIYNEREDKVTFIDYEYSANNYQAYDIANHFAEFVGISDIDYRNYPSRELQLAWLQVYLAEYAGEACPCACDVERLYTQVNQFVLAAHFLWGAWALVQDHLSHIHFDFIQFASVRFNEYYRLKDGVFADLS